MSDSLPAPQPDDAPPSQSVPAESVPEPDQRAAPSPEEPEAEIAHDPAALAADRAGFKFLAVGFAIFFALIVICASAVALVMKSMGI